MMISKGKLRGGSIRALVEHLTLHDAIDPKFTQAFLLTFKIFMSTTDFLKMLQDRFQIPRPQMGTLQEIQHWIDTKKSAIQLQ